MVAGVPLADVPEVAIGAFSGTLGSVALFFDAGLVVFLPIIFSVARKFGGSVLLYALPTAGAFAAMHAIVPPHPGPVTAATELGGSIELTLLVGLPVALVSWYVGVYLVTTAYAGKIMVPIKESMLVGGKSGDPSNLDDDAGARCSRTSTTLGSGWSAASSGWT